MGVHDHRRLGRAVRSVYERVAAEGTATRKHKPGAAPRWSKLVIALGAVATLLWMLLLSWAVAKLAQTGFSWLGV